MQLITYFVFLFAVASVEADGDDEIPSDGDGDIEIRFEPIGVGGNPAGASSDMISALLGARGSPSGDMEEPNLDAMLGQMLDGDGVSRDGPMLRGNPSFGTDGGDDVVVEGGAPGLPQIFDMSSSYDSQFPRKSSHAQEANLDTMLQQMLGGGLAGAMGGQRLRSRGARAGSMSAGSPSFGDGMVDGAVMIEAGADGSPQVVEMSDGPSGLPAGLLRDLFPGPLQVGARDHPQPFDTPDYVIQDMVSGLDEMFTDSVLPMVHRAASMDRAPDTCKGDLKAHCASAASPIHCLGQHVEDVSAACHVDIGKSVPYRCSKYIDQFCDLLSGGILACLQAHMEALDASCKDSVSATSQVISKTKTQKASVVHPTTGVTKVSAPSGSKNVSPSVGSKSRAPVASLLGTSYVQVRSWWPYVGLYVAFSALVVYAVTYTPYCPRKLRALLTSDLARTPLATTELSPSQ